MRRFSFSLLFLILVAWPSTLQASVPSDARTPARQKPGPVTVRGVATHVTSHSLTLQTATRGSYAVSISPKTTIDEKGRRGRVIVTEGDHVGVRGFVHGRQMTAMRIRIYPVKPKQYSLRGTVTAVRGSDLVVNTAGKVLTIHTSGSTQVRIGNQTGALRQIQSGDRVDVRVEGTGGHIVGLHLHIYRSRSPVSHAELRGTLTSIMDGSVTIISGSHQQTVSVTSSTHIYLGARRGSARDLKAGQTVRVYTVSAGRALTATSIHIRQTPVSVVTTLLRGQVTSVSAKDVKVATAHGTLTFALASTTVVEVGSTRTAPANLRVGDQVSVRASHTGSSWIATRIHVYAAYRSLHTLSGTVLSNTRAGLVISTHGKRYTVMTSRGTAVSISGSASGVGAIQPGDHVHVSGLLHGTTAIAAQRISVKRAAAKSQTVRGTVGAVGRNSLVIVDVSGGKHPVRLVSGGRVLLHGKPAPATALFSGVHATARGHISGGVLLATTVSLSVSTRSVKGKVTWSSRYRFVVQRSSGAIGVDLTSGTVIRDGKSAPRSVQPGSYVRVRGYAEPSGAVRATSVTVAHPLINVAAVVVATSPTLLVQTSRGDRFRLLITSGTVLSTGREQVDLKVRDVPVGARVHVHGVAASNGLVQVQELDVRLASLMIRGQLTAVKRLTWTVQVAGTARSIRVLGRTTVSQGSHTLTTADVAVGDDVTVYGYAIAGGLILARKVVIHRILTGLDGTIASLTADGFMLTVTGESDRIILSVTTIVTGGTTSDLIAGAAVHVTGYRRGDGVILASRVRIGKKHG